VDNCLGQNYGCFIIKIIFDISVQYLFHAIRVNIPCCLRQFSRTKRTCFCLFSLALKDNSSRFKMVNLKVRQPKKKLYMRDRHYGLSSLEQVELISLRDCILRVAYLYSSRRRQIDSITDSRLSRPRRLLAVLISRFKEIAIHSPEKNILSH